MEDYAFDPALSGPVASSSGVLLVPRPGAEPERVRAVLACDLLDAPPAPEFSDMVRQAARLCGTPMAAVTLVTDDRMWLAATVGLGDVRELDRREAFCSHTILDSEPMIVPDMRADPRFVDNPLVSGEPWLRFYAGVPLITRDRFALGTLCVLDDRPRTITAEQIAELRELAAAVTLGLELRRASHALAATERALTGQRAMHDAIVAAALDCIVTIDAAGCIVEFNPAAQQTFGYARDEALGRDMADLIIPAPLREAHRRGFARLMATGAPHVLNQRIELSAVRRDGTEFPVELTVTQLAADPPMFAGHIRDITERRRAEADQLQLAAIVRCTQDAVVGLDRERRVTHWNRGAELLYGYSAAEMIGTDMSAIMPADLLMEATARFDRVLAGEPVSTVETQRRAKEGTRLEVAVTLSPVFDGAGRLVGLSAISREIGERKQLEAMLRHEADHDPLTDLVNRRVFETRLEQLIDTRVVQASVVLVDLDHFKLVNDSLGHRAGDDIIRQVATLLQTGVRADDTVARLGGDEFALLLANCPELQAVGVAEQLIDRIGRQIGVHSFGASAGVVGIVAGATAEDVMVAADVALYDAKSQGRRRAVRHGGRGSRVLHEVARIRERIANGRMVLFAQPIVDLVDDSVVEHELLVRMLDEDDNLIAPDRFIPVAERFGLIESLDRWVLGGAAGLARGGAHVAVNLSAQTLSDPTFIDVLHREIRSGVPAGNLGFEITETAALRDVESAGEFARTLRRLGCSLALDDFGTGFGSLLHLKHLPVTTIKIDIEFVRHLVTSSADKHIVEGLVGMARRLGRTTVAEGVEDAQTLDLLRELGVDRAQGYFLGRPAPVDLARMRGLRSPEPRIA